MHEVMHEVVYTFKLVNSLLQVEEFRFLSLKTKRFRVMNCVKNNVLQFKDVEDLLVENVLQHGDTLGVFEDIWVF